MLSKNTLHANNKKIRSNNNITRLFIWSGRFRGLVALFGGFFAVLRCRFISYLSYI